MSTLTPSERLKFLEKARAKKAQSGAKVDVLPKQDIAEGDNKRKRKEKEQGRLTMEIPGKESGSGAARLLMTGAS
jgi:hypothetical protein